MRPNCHVVQRTNPVRCSSAVPTIAFESNDQLSVPKYRNVRVMGARDDLTFTFQPSKISNDALINEAVVEVIFRLIDHKRSARRSKQEQEQGRGTLAF